ncbi:MAG: hypothetical protein PSV24_03905 [Rhodoferax sp.]|nr:hypothetical protein [Rhodoferax sp.]
MRVTLRAGLTLFAIAAVMAGYYFWGRTDEPMNPMPASMPATLGPTAHQDPVTTSADGTSNNPGKIQPLTTRVFNPLQRTADLRSIYEQYRDSKDTSERNIAYLAWSACFPTFIAAQGGMVPVEDVTAALPANDPNRELRAAAYRALWGRCKGFSDMARDRLLAETQKQRDAWMSGRAHAPGDSAAQAHMAGSSQQALTIARAAVASQDPYAIGSLREFVIHYWWDHNDNHPDDQVDRPDLRALAFSIVACQTGLECGAGSLTAMQQCANSGACSGTVLDRYLQSLPTQEDRDAVLEESRRIADAIRANDYKALGL